MGEASDPFFSVMFVERIEQRCYHCNERLSFVNKEH